MATNEYSLAQQFSMLPKEERDKIIESMTPKQLADLNYDWRWWARPKQLKCFEEADWSTFIYLAGRGFGKAAAINTPLLKSDGKWTTLQDIKAGEYIFDEQGNPTQVTQVHEIYTPEECYRLHFDDGTSIDACADHYWATWTARERKQYRRKNKNLKTLPKDWVRYIPKNLKNTRISVDSFMQVLQMYANKHSCKSIAATTGLTPWAVSSAIEGKFDNSIEVFGNYRTTKEIYETQICGNRGDTNHCIPNAAPLQYQEKSLPLDPYILGVWLGDGSSGSGSIAQAYKNGDKKVLVDYISKFYEITGKVESPSFYVKGLVRDLKKIGVYSEKHIPADYLTGSIEQRLELLRGLMDTDGYAAEGVNSCEFSQSNETLAMQVYYLLVSLGMKATVSSRIPVNSTTGKTGKKNWRIMFYPTMQVFNLPRKASRLSFHGNQYAKRLHRMIVKVERINPVPMRCITVDSPNAMYLIGEQLVPTRNTRTGTEWVKHIAETKPGSYIAVVGPTTQSVNRTLVEGPTGLLSICAPGTVTYQRTKAQLTWKNGSVAMLYSAEKPDRLRGPNHHYALADEVVAWKNPETWDMLQFTMRIGNNPQTLVTTTPKPTDLVLRIIGGDENVGMVNASEFSKIRNTVIVRGTTFENTALSSQALDNYRDMYENTVLGEQELYAKLLVNIQGALFKKEWLKHYGLYSSWEDGAEARPEPTYVQTVVAVDPAVTAKSGSDQTAICVVSKGADGFYYVRHCEGHRKTPQGWGEEVVRLYKRFNADKIIVETNNGGDMVENTVRAVTRYTDNNKTYSVDGYTLPIEKIHAKKGKLLRAEEVALLYEQGRVIHLHTFSELEAQMLVFKGEPNGSDDLVDAMVYGIKDLLGSRIVDSMSPVVLGNGLVSDRLGFMQ